MLIKRAAAVAVGQYIRIVVLERFLNHEKGSYGGLLKDENINPIICERFKAGKVGKRKTKIPPSTAFTLQ
jgi:hypothetical protein